MGKLGRVKIPLENFEEIKDGPKDQSKDLLFGWLQNDLNREALLLNEDVDTDLLQKVVSVGYANDLSDDEIELLGRDPFLIAYGLAFPSDRYVVTVEASTPKKTRQNRHIPDVCNSLDVKWCDPFAMARALGFKTNWQTG